MSDAPSKTPSFLERAELSRRLEAAGLDAIVAMSPSNVWYLSGHGRVFGSGQRPGYAAATLAVATRSGDPTLIVSRWHAGIAKALSWTESIVQFRNYSESAFITAANFLEERGLAAGNIGVELTYVPDGDFRDLAAALPEATFHDLGDTLSGLRSRRNSAQSERAAEGYERLARALLAGLEQAAVGEGRDALHRRIMRRLLELGSDTGVGGIGAPHERIVPLVSTAAEPLRSGEVLNLDYMCTFGAYAARICRPVFVGEVASAQLELYGRQREALAAAVAAMTPGMAASRAYQLVLDALAARGLECRSPVVGHGVGHAFEDLPVLSPTSDHVLEPGMELVLEPRTSTSLLLSLRVVVTEQGLEASATGFPTDQPYVIPA